MMVSRFGLAPAAALLAVQAGTATADPAPAAEPTAKVVLAGPGTE